MNFAARASTTLSRAAADLEAMLQSDRGPEPRELRRLVGALYDAAGMLMQSASDIEQGVES